MDEHRIDPNTAPIETLLESCLEQYPELLGADPRFAFEAAHRKNVFENGIGVRRGDLLIRRQYGHHQPAWAGVVEFVHGNEGFLLTLNGRKKSCSQKMAGNWTGNSGGCDRNMAKPIGYLRAAELAPVHHKGRHSHRGGAVHGAAQRRTVRDSGLATQFRDPYFG